jgi:hypothetical protein
LSMTPRVPWCTLVGIAGWWNSLLSYADLILSSTLKGGIHCCWQSSCNESTSHQKISVLYRLCIETHNWTPSCINYLYTPISHNMLDATTST